MSYQVLARKWRPRSFREMVGQTHVLKALINALDSQRLHHAYLFTGTRGVGKTTIARIIAKCLNCETGISSTPCGTCSVCREIDEGRFVDLIEVDAASRTKVEDTRELLDNVQYSPSRGRFKVYLIDEVHMLSTSSFNALLKTLEEPPPHVKFLLATTDPQKLPVTVLSRCLQFSLKNMPPERVVEHLTHVLTAENVPFEDDALWLLGRAADGSMRDAMSLTDQAIAFGEGKVLAADVRAMLGTLDHGQVYGVLHALIEGDARALIEAVRHLAEQGPDWNGVLSEMLNVLHRVAIAQALPEAVDNGQGDRERVLQLAQALPAEDVQFYYQMGLIGRRDLPLAPEPRGGFEMVLLRMLAFRPAGADDAPKVTLKPLGISQATADSQQNPVAGTAMPAPVVSAPVIAPVAQTPVVTAVVEPSPVVPAPSVTPVVSEPVQPVEVPVAPAANLPVDPEPAAPVVDVPWATAKAAEPVAEPVQPVAPAEPEVKTAEPVVAQVASVEVPAPSEVAPPVADADGGEDEPPLGDYDYVEMDAETLDYDFGQAETAAPVVEEPLPAAKPATGLAAEWLSLFPQLGLGGMTGSIAANCTLIEANGDDWLLHLDPAHSALFNPTQQRRLNDALNQQQGRSIKLRIELCKPEQETPAQAAARRRADRQRSAEASIHGDPLVQQMIQQFAAKVRDDSIEPIDIPS
ncbi:DNA polymerase III subunit gamma/tau [Pseudomonas chengduensis]|jgi:DNA polymerase III subunit gamma/tau|uniref:DNA polymerase III subunit gamma/tau n=1 Tax=Ectopseudomonas chengduensis TaxID=489632 RepID=A0A1G6LQ07_9GAMM|nr:MULTISPECIES: DNA polymerase III subunit gamma/tau [Pseudomonas]KQO40866.1 DNA polymerase III subunit gamma/tau [Pseudomonas sp. Leaf83]MBP3060666.1 DNA polymerase III subunit gamma/tau [Pseudomonas chengduensis]MDH0957317.1 DNA polymerase III subunit gamma/tau [Pseudomonas chengduensis]MDH1535749.1 DNA polymerase III subunit gamma/tau [Pseudomonas chengduensis]NNB73742.1 DNA polymerase III subunit gamma/tau [Pseudomonas chengduensis]